MEKPRLPQFAQYESLSSSSGVDDATVAPARNAGDRQMTVEPCECLVRVMRAVANGTAHCNRHALYGEKRAGTIRASRVPFPSSIPGTLHLKREKA